MTRAGTRAGPRLALALSMCGCGSGGVTSPGASDGEHSTNASSSAGASQGSSSTQGFISQTSTGSVSGTSPSTGSSSATASSSSNAASSTAASDGGAPSPDPAAVARVTGWFAELPYGQNNIGSNQATYADAIVGACAAFGPPDSEDAAGWPADWQVYCQAIITAAILKESSYNASEVVTDAYATRTVTVTTTETADDPTVGLLQIRFSSTVHDFNAYGPIAKLVGVGCNYPALGHDTESGDSDFWAVSGPTANLAFMESIPCNVGLAAWYYFLNATGNGGSTAIYAQPYCAGSGVAGDVVIGLLSHLLGPAGAHPPDPTNAYVTFIKQWFTTFVGAVPSPDPFTVALAPSPAQYCQ